MRLKSNPKRIISLALAGCMAVSMVPASAVTAFAAETGTGSAVTTSVTVEVEVKSFTTGQLSEAIQGVQADVSEITLLKVSGGELNADDFYYIRDNLTALESLDLSGATCVNNKIPDNALYDNDGQDVANNTLKTFLFPQNITEVGADAFYRCSALNDFGYGEGVLQMPETITVVGNRSFAYLKGFDSIKLPQNLQTAGTWSFAYCDNLEGIIVIPDTLKVIPKAMFETSVSAGVPESNYITSVVIPEGVTKIDDFAFRNRSALEKINFPSALVEIGKEVFSNCSALKDVKLNENLQSIGYVTFATSGVRYVKLPAASHEYKSSFVGIVDFTACSGTKVSEVNGNVIYVLSDDSNVDISQNPTTLTKVYTNGGQVESADWESRTVVLAKEGYTFEGWYENKEFTGDAVTTIDTGKTYYAKWHHNADLKADVDNSEASQKGVLVNEPVEVTVKLEPNEDNIDDVLNGTGYAAFDFSDPDAVAFVECGGVKFTGEELKARNYKIQISELMTKAQSGIETYSTNPAIAPGTLAITMKIAYNKEGDHKLAVAVLNSSSNLICSSEKVLIKVIKPEEPKKDDDKKDDTKPENPVTTYALTVKDGTVKVNGKDAALTDGVIAVEKDAKVEVTFDKSTLSDAQVFDQWTITPASVLNAVDPKSETISFTMPAEEVTIKAMTRDATIEDDGPGVLGTAAMIGVGVAGTAVLGYQDYMIGTELYLNNVLPAGAAIPNNATELALLVWNDAGKPAPAAVLAPDATDEQKALTWAVENQLISADKAADASVTRWEVIQTWNQEQEMKKA